MFHPSHSSEGLFQGLSIFLGLVPLPCDQMFSPSSLQRGPGQSWDGNRLPAAPLLPRTWTAAGDRGQGTLHSVLPWLCPGSQGSLVPILPTPAELWQHQRQRGAESNVGQCVGQGVVAPGLGVVGMLEPLGDAGMFGKVLEYLGGCWNIGGMLEYVGWGY